MWQGQLYWSRLNKKNMTTQNRIDESKMCHPSMTFDLFAQGDGERSRRWPAWCESVCLSVSLSVSLSVFSLFHVVVLDLCLHVLLFSPPCPAPQMRRRRRRRDWGDCSTSCPARYARTTAHYLIINSVEALTMKLIIITFLSPCKKSTLPNWIDTMSHVILLLH